MLLKHDASSFSSYSQKTIKIATTLSDLLNVLNEEVRAGEKGLVEKIVYYWIESGRLKFIPHCQIPFSEFRKKFKE
jgi:hypothetical protein